MRGHSYAELDEEYPLLKSCNSCRKLLMGGKGVLSPVKFLKTDEGVWWNSGNLDELSWEQLNKPDGFLVGH